MSDLTQQFDKKYGEALQVAPASEQPQDVVPTSGGSQPEQPGIMSQLLSGTMENLPAAGYAVTRTLFGGPQMDNVITKAERGAEGGQDAALMTAADRASFGLLDTLAGGRAQAQAILSGKSTTEAAEIGDETANQVNLNLAEARQEHKGMSLVGDVYGAIIGGAPLLKGAQAVAGATSTFIAPALAAGGEEFIYQLNSDASLTEAGTKAGIAAALSGIGSKVISGGQGIYTKLFKGQSTKALQREMGAELVAAMKTQSAIKTGKELTTEQALKQLDELGPEQVISDLYPSLQRKVFLLASSSDERVQRQAINLLKTRNELDFNYRQRIMDVINSPKAPRSEVAFNKYLDTAQKQLRPKYDDLFNRMDQAKWAVEVPTVRDSITKLIDDSLSTAGDDLSTLMKLIDDASPRGRMSFREVNQLRKAVNNEIYRRLRHNNSSANAEVLPIGNLQNARNYLRNVLNTNDEFVRLQQTYGDLENARNAYKFGQSIINRGKMEGADADIFLEGNKSGLVADALTEGSRHALHTKAKTASDPAAVLKPGMLDDLRALLGDEPVDAMKAQADELVNMKLTNEAVEKGSRAATSSENTKFLGQNIMDIRASGEGISGGASGVAPMFAMRRLLDSLQNPTAKPLKGELNRRLAVQGAALLEPGGEGAKKAIEAYLKGATKTGAPLAGIGMAGPAVDSSAGDAVGAAGGATYDAILRYLQENQ